MEVNQTYLNIYQSLKNLGISSKTAELFAAATKVGAIPKSALKEWIESVI